MHPYISILSIFLAFLMTYRNWKINRNTIFLSAFIIVFAIYALVHYFLLMGDSVFWLAVFYNNTAPICYLAGPLLYFYVKGTLFDKSRPGRKDWYHLIPTIINLISVTPYLLTSFDYKLNHAKILLEDTMAAKTITVGLYPNIINAAARPILLCIYCTASIVLIYQFSLKMKRNKYIPQKQSSLVLKWLIFFVSIVSVTVLSFTYVSILFWKESNPDITKLNAHLSMYLIGFCLLLIPISLIVFPEILYGIPQTRKNHKKYLKNLKIKSEVIIEEKNNFENLQNKTQIGIIQEKYISEEDFEPKFVKLSEMILLHIKESQIFLNPNFSMEELSRSMNIPKHHLYYCFNSILKIKLTKLRAELRVEYAKKLIEDGFLDSLTLDAIGSKAGFSSRSSFQSTFKDEVGCTPGEYLKLVS